MSSKLDFEFLHEKESLEKYKSSKSFKWFLMAFLCFVLALGLSAAYSLGKIKGRSFEAENVVLQGIGASEIVNNNEEGELDKNRRLLRKRNGYCTLQELLKPGRV